MSATRAGAEEQTMVEAHDTAKSFEVYREWLALARPAPGPDGLRRPLWLPRAFKPDASAYRM